MPTETKQDDARSKEHDAGGLRGLLRGTAVAATTLLALAGAAKAQSTYDAGMSYSSKLVAPTGLVLDQNASGSAYIKAHFGDIATIGLRGTLGPIYRPDSATGIIYLNEQEVSVMLHEGLGRLLGGSLRGSIGLQNWTFSQNRREWFQRSITAAAAEASYSGPVDARLSLFHAIPAPVVRIDSMSTSATSLQSTAVSASVSKDLFILDGSNEYKGIMMLRPQLLWGYSGKVFGSRYDPMYLMAGGSVKFGTKGGILITVTEMEPLIGRRIPVFGLTLGLEGLPGS